MGWAAVLPGLGPPCPRPLPSLQPLGPLGAWQRCPSHWSGRGAAVLRIRPRYVPRWGPWFPEAQRRVPGRRGGWCGFLETRWGAGAPRPSAGVGTRFAAWGPAGRARRGGRAHLLHPMPWWEGRGIGRRGGEQPKPGSRVLCPAWPGVDLWVTPLEKEIVGDDSMIRSERDGAGRRREGEGEAGQSPGRGQPQGGRGAWPAPLGHSRHPLPGTGPLCSGPHLGRAAENGSVGSHSAPQHGRNPYRQLGVLDRFPRT